MHLQIRVQRGFFTSTIGLTILGIIFGIFVIAGGIFTYYYMKYSRKIDARIEHGIFENTTQIFSAPEHISAAEAWGPADLTDYLTRVGYRPQQDPIALGQYTELAVTHAPKAFEEREIDEALEHLREQHAEFRTVERPADVHDLVIMDYTMTPEGSEPRTETGYGFVVGSGSVMPEVEEAVIGLSAGGERTARVRFPDDHRNEALRGKAGEARVQVTEVKEKILPPLDDELAKTVGQFDTLTALRAEVEKGLKARREQENRRALEDAVTEAVMAGHPVEVPEALVLRQVGHLIEHTRERVRRQGMDPDKLPWDYGKLLEELKPGAEKAVRRALVLEAIADKEGLAPTDADIDAEVEKIAVANNRPVPAVRRIMQDNGDLDGLRHSLRESRTLDFLISKSTVSA